jgi:DNA-directed RNA polymerase subunit M
MFPQNGTFRCGKCGQERSTSGSKQVFTTQTKVKEMLIIESIAPTLPRTNVECPTCGNNEAFWVLRQTRAADEPETKIYRCVKCSHSWREY